MNLASSSQDVASHRQDASDDGRRESSGGDTSPGGRRRSLSGSILSRLSFLRASSDGDQSPVDTSSGNLEVSREDAAESPKKPSRAMAAVVQQQKTRRRKGSLRKAALLGRGAQREQKDSKVSAIDTNQSLGLGNDGFSDSSPTETLQTAGFGLGISDATPRPSMDGYASRLNNTLLPPIRTLPMGTEDHLISPPTSLATSPTLTYTSTTDEDDILGIPSHTIPPRGGPIMSSGSDSYFPQTGGIPRRRSSKKPKSPLAVSGLTATAMPVPDGDWDYSETEWWGWVVLIVTWIVFVTGMGSCLGVWSWAWDVGETPYAPPELEDDPTLPVTGYYPALIILTAVMAWVWVVVAWVGMKYFRHAKISGD